jgi:hypothetical protein
MGKTSKVAKRIQGGQPRDTRSAAVPTCAAAHARDVLANAENEKSPSMTGFLFMSSGLAGFDRGRTGRDRSDSCLHADFVTF